MRRTTWFISLAGLLALLVASPAPAEAAKRLALVIGIDAYHSLPPLQKAVNDARAVSGALEEIGFAVVTAENPDRRTMNRRLADLEARITTGDTVLFYFAGHGVALGAENVLLAADMAKPAAGEEALVEEEGILVDRIVRRIQAKGAGTTLVVLDACRNNPFEAAGTRGIGLSRGLVAGEAASGVFVLFSAGIGQEALDRLSDDDPNPNSVFTRALVPLLKTPGLSQVQLAKRVQREVSALAATIGHPQQPAYYDQIVEEVVLREGVAASVEAAPLEPAASAAPLSEAAVAWEAAKDSGNQAMLEAIVRRFPDSVFADFARERLNQLEVAIVSPPEPLGVATRKAEDVLIAATGPMTGPYASFGSQIKAGAEAAVKDINDAGGVNGSRLVLEIGDDACDPKQAVAVAQSLASKGIKFVAGHFCSSSSIPASKVYEREGIVQITPASSNPRLTDEGGWNVHRVAGRDDAQGAVAGAFLARRYAGRRVAIIHDGSHYGRGLAEATKRAMNAAGLEEAIYEAYSAGGSDYSALVSRFKDARVDAVYAGGYATDVGLILRQMREEGVKAQMVSGDALATDEFWAIAGAAGEGTVMTFTPDPRRFPSARAVVDSFTAAGVNPEGYTLPAYAAIQAWAKAAKALGTFDSRKIAEWLRAGNTLHTVLGELSLDRKGDVKNAMHVLYVWSDGKYAETTSP